MNGPLRLVTVLAACSAALPAQASLAPSTLTPRESQAPVGIEPRRPTEVAIGAPDEDGATWVRGERYKLGLLAGGASFQPLFGPQAPRDFPVQFALAEAAMGEASLPLPAGAWQQDGQRFRRDRGALRECWQVAFDGAQQYFEVPRPVGSGALTLRIACATDLLLVDDGPGVRFVAPGLGEVRYSDATILDARGERLDVAVEVVAGQLTIVVPASFTARATWPLLVDPLVTTIAVDTTVSDIQDARVACEPTTGNWLIVAEEHLSATDVDVLTSRYSAANPPSFVDTVYAENSTAFTHNPAVGFVAATQQFLIAWHNRTGSSGSGSFQLRNRQAGSTTQGGVVETSGGIGNDLANRPLIGSSLTGNLWLLVLCRRNFTGTDILANLRANTGIGFGTMFVGPLLAPSQGTMEPGGVSTLATAADKWVVAWRECTTAACSTQIVRMQAIGASGASLVPDPTVTVATGSSFDNVAIAGHGGNLLAVWRAFDTTTLSNDIHGVPIGLTAGQHAPQGAAQNLSAQEPNVSNLREHFAPAVSYDGCRFVYGYLEDDGNDILLPHAATVFVSGSAIAWHEGHLALTTITNRTCRSFALAPGSNGNLGHHLAVWQQDSPTFTGDLGAAWIEARVPGALTSIAQTGCGGATEPTISLTGSPALGRTFTVSLGNVPVFPVLMVGPESFNLLPGCGSCQTGIDLAGLQLFAVSSLGVTVPCDPALLQFRLAFQGMSGLQPGGCPTAFLGFPFTLSDTLTIQVL